MIVFDFQFTSFSWFMIYLILINIHIQNPRALSLYNIIYYKPLGLVTIESSSVDYSLTTLSIEDSKVACVSAKVTCIRSFLLNMILMLLFLGYMIFSWIHNYLLASPYCSSCNCICMYLARTYDPDVDFHAFSSL